MVDVAPPNETEIVGTAVTSSPLTADAPARIPVERYISASFAELEHARLWPKVWHVACTVDHVANPGDWFEHRLGRYSILLVRGDDGVLRGFQNVCRHRGNTICVGSGTGASELRCPYHRWAWTCRATTPLRSPASASTTSSPTPPCWSAPTCSR